MTRSLLLIFLIFILAVAGCSRGVDKAELPGRYEFSLDNMKQQVTIGADGKYSNALYRGGALVWSEQGVWTYYEAAKKGRTEIMLDKFRFGIPEYASGGSWFVVPEKTLTGVKALCFDPDLNRCFRAS
jgi:hypothetical protein